MTLQNQADPLLASPFDALRSALALHHTPPGVEKELMAAFAQRYPKRPWYRRLSSAQWGMAGGLGSTAVVVTVFMLSLHTPLEVGGAGGPPLLGFDDGAAFVALESLERIESEPEPRMVETDVPRTTLAALGVPLTPENAGESVRAELLVGADGQPLALRLSNPQ
ncbi:MAG TPA: hypothetical protein VFG03_14645 [Telluria sp.]|nr:hypothetical protein [Telluria sp.]